MTFTRPMVLVRWSGLAMRSVVSSGTERFLPLHLNDIIL